MYDLAQVLGALDDPCEEVRIRAIQTLPPEVRTPQLLSTRLTDSSTRVRELAADGLIALGASVLGEVLPYLEHGEPSVRALALAVAQRIGLDGLPMVKGLMASADKDLRKFGIEILAVMPSTEAEELIVCGLADDDPNVLLAAVEALGARSATDAVPMLVDLLERGGPLLLQFALIEALARLGAHEALEAIIALARRNPLLIPAAIEAWGMLGKTEGFSEMFALAHSSHNGDMLALLDAASNLCERGETFGPAALSILKPLAVANATDLETALSLMLKLAPEALPEVLPELIKADPVSERLLTYLAEQPEVLVALLSSTPSALELLARLAQEELLPSPASATYVDQLAALAKNPDPQVTYQAACVLEYLAGPEALTTLWRLANHEDPEIACCALRALGRIGGPSLGDVVLEALNRPEPSVWATAVRLLDAHGSLPYEPRMWNLYKVHRGTERGLYILGVLAKMGARVNEEIEGYLDHPDSRICHRAVVLRLKGVQPPLSLVNSLLNDPDPLVRFAAIHFLANQEGDEVIKLLAYVLRYEEMPENRLEALGILIAQGGGRALQLLGDEVTSFDELRSQAVLEALLEFAQEGGDAILAAWKEGDDENLKNVAQEALDRLDDLAVKERDA